MGTTGNKPPVRNAIWILLLIAILGSFGWCSRADAESVVSYGQPLIGGDRCSFSSLSVQHEFMQRRFLAGLTAQGEGQCRGEFVDANITAYGILLFPVGRRFDIGFGAGVREHGDLGVGHNVSDFPPRRADGLQLVAAILIRSYWFKQRVTLDFPLHFSTGGSTTENRGWNFIQAGYRF